MKDIVGVTLLGDDDLEFEFEIDSSEWPTLKKFRDAYEAAFKKARKGYYPTLIMGSQREGAEITRKEDEARRKEAEEARKAAEEARLADVRENGAFAMAYKKAMERKNNGRN